MKWGHSTSGSTLREQLADWQAAIDSQRALNPAGRYPDWEQTIAGRSVMRILTYRPGRANLATRIPDATLVRVPGRHYAPILEQHEPVVEAEVAFLRTHLRVG